MSDRASESVPRRRHASRNPCGPTERSEDSMSRNKVITADAAAGLVLAGDTIATTGFVGTGFPEELAQQERGRAICGARAATVGKWRARFVEHRLDGLARRAAAGSRRRRSPPIRSRMSWWRRWSRRRRTPRIGRGRRWPSARAVEVDDRADLEGLRPQAAPRGRVQALQRPAVRGEGPRRRRPVPGPARVARWCCVWTRSRRSRPWPGRSQRYR